MRPDWGAVVFADAKKKKKISKAETYKIYIYKVLKQVHPDTGEFLRKV